MKMRLWRSRTMEVDRRRHVPRELHFIEDIFIESFTFSRTFYDDIHDNDILDGPSSLSPLSLSSISIIIIIVIALFTQVHLYLSNFPEHPFDTRTEQDLVLTAKDPL